MKVEFEGEITYVDGRYNAIISDLQPDTIYQINLDVKYSWYDCPLNSTVVYKSDENGIINFNKMLPIKGKYKIIDSMGYIYGLRYAKGNFYKRKDRDFTKEYVSYEYKITGNDDTYKTKLIRRFTSEDIKCIKIRDQFVGDYYYHEKSNKCLILLGGSEGYLNVNLPIAACMANKGIDVVAVQYFDPEDCEGRGIVPNRLRMVSVEYINLVVDWLYKQVPDREIYIMGVSRGAELALLCASLNDKIKKVISIAPSAYVFQGCGTMESAWQINGKPIPFIKFNPLVSTMEQTVYNILALFHITTGYFFTYEISSKLAINKEKTRIKVENINGDICVLAGKKDRMWNGVKAIKAIQTALEKSKKENKKENKNSHKFECWIYEKAGHCFYTPFIFPITNTLGGRKLDNYYANEDMWIRVIEFIFS